MGESASTFFIALRSKNKSQVETVFSAFFPGPVGLKCEQNENAGVGLDKGEL